MSSPVLSTAAAELLKLARRPAAWVLLAAAAILNLIFAYLIPYLSYSSGGGGGMSDGATPQQQLASTLPDQLVATTISGFAVFAGALALVLGALMFGGEYGWGTVKTMLTQRAGGATVLFGRSDEGGVVPFQPFLEALEHQFTHGPAGLVERQPHGGRIHGQGARLINGR